MISIIIPNYNRAKYIEETLVSIRKQSFPDWEAIIVGGEVLIQDFYWLYE